MIFHRHQRRIFIGQRLNVRADLRAHRRRERLQRADVQLSV
jgi:hypothetical protein